MRRVAAAVVLLLLLAGCGITGTTSSGIGYPAGPSLQQFGLNERCGAQDSSCNDRALEIIRELLGGLGPRVENPEAQGPTEGQPDGLLIVTGHSNPAFDLVGAGATTGTTDVVLDLTPTLDGEGAPYVVLDGDAFEIDPEGAAALLDALFVRLD